jgi:hypothetical protein
MMPTIKFNLKTIAYWRSEEQLLRNTIIAIFASTNHMACEVGYAGKSEDTRL